MTAPRFPEVVVNPGLARMADPPPSRARRGLLVLACLSWLTAAVVLIVGGGWPMWFLAAGNATAAGLLAWLAEARQ